MPKLNYMILPPGEGGLYKYRIVLNTGEVKSTDFLNKEDMRQWLKTMHSGGLYDEYSDLADFAIAGREKEEDE